MMNCCRMIVHLCLMYFGCCIYVLLLLNMPEMAHDWINKVFYSILSYSMPNKLFYSILFYRSSYFEESHDGK